MGESIKCPYCEGNALLTRSTEVYSRDYGWLYLCRPCFAYVGCHKGTTKPKGSPANRELREQRKHAHAAFDPVWRQGKMKRTEAYKWLANELNIDGSDCHIGMFDIDQCKAVVEVCANQ